MGKFKVGTKGILQYSDLEFGVEGIPEYNVLPELKTITEYVDKEVIREILIDRVTEKIVEVERIVEIEKIVEKLIVSPELQNKVAVMSKEIEDLKNKLVLSNMNMSINIDKLEKDHTEKIESLKTYVKDLKQDNSVEHTKFKKQISNIEYCMMGLLVLSIIGMVI